MNKALDSLHTKILNSKFAEEVTLEEIEALVVAKNNDWIYCSNMLPGYDVSVLLSLKNKYSYIGYRTIIMEEEHFYIEENGYVKPEEVIAWMPLPHLYKEEGV